MPEGLEIEADLVVALNNDPFLIVAEENFIIINFKDLKSLERIMKNAGTISLPELSPGQKPTEKSESRQSTSGGPFKKLNMVNETVLALKLIVDVRVGGKSYVTFGAGNSAKIKAAAIFGKISSFFGM